jgi:hypothetical protein
MILSATTNAVRVASCEMIEQGGARFTVSWGRVSGNARFSTIKMPPDVVYWFRVEVVMKGKIFSGKADKPVALVLLVTLTAFIASINPFTHSSNCGGNSAALAAVQDYAMFARMAAEDSADHSFHITSATPEQLTHLTNYTLRGWLPNVRFLVSTQPVPEPQTKEGHRVIIVCDTPFNNVPRRLIGSAPFTHAAGFSDGSTGLISQGEFAKLDRTSFKFLDEIHPMR